MIEIFGPTGSISMSAIVMIGILDAPIVTSHGVECELKRNNRATTIDHAIVYSSKAFNVDADGAPNSYRVDGRGLSFTCDGVAAVENGRKVRVGEPDWEAKCQNAWKTARASGDYSKVAIFGFATDFHGVPMKQKEGDPLPDEAFISTTAVHIPDAIARTQRQYIDATAIPYVVLPANLRSLVKQSAVAAVWRPKTQALVFAVFGDTGGALDEGSVRLHQDLGSVPLVSVNHVLRAKGRIEDSILVVVFPTQPVKPRLDSAEWRGEIEKVGRAALDAWGGVARLQGCQRP